MTLRKQFFLDVLKVCSWSDIVTATHFGLVAPSFFCDRPFFGGPASRGFSGKIALQRIGKGPKQSRGHFYDDYTSHYSLLLEQLH